MTVGPSFRQIFDFAGEGPIRSILPSGESGQVFHPHYADQTQPLAERRIPDATFTDRPGRTRRSARAGARAMSPA